MTATSSPITLIGMAGVGKSTVGRALARLDHRRFVDTDTLIEERVGCSLQEYLDREGMTRLAAREQEVLLTIGPGRLVVATGGSAIYSETGMAHLRGLGPIVLLEADLDTLLDRITNLDQRGLVDPDGTGFAALYRSRMPLYRRWADLRVPALDAPQRVAARILAAVSGRPDQE